MPTLDDITPAVLVTLAITLISFGVNLVTSGVVPEGIACIIVGLLILAVYYLVILPNYVTAKFGIKMKK